MPRHKKITSLEARLLDLGNRRRKKAVRKARIYTMFEITIGSDEQKMLEYIRKYKAAVNTMWTDYITEADYITE